MTCPYQPCGSNENCIGCCEDPQHRPMTLPELYDACSCIRCSDCTNYSCRDDLRGSGSPCKRLDHERIKFYTSSEVYTAEGPICQDFQPNGRNKWLARHWSPDFLKTWIGEYEADRPSNNYVSLILDGDDSVRYDVRYEDWFYGRFINADGSLLWFRKYTKIPQFDDAGRPDGYKLLQELNPDMEAPTRVELRPGYHEWNLYIGSKLIYSLEADWDESMAGMTAEEMLPDAEATIYAIIDALRDFGDAPCIEKHDMLKKHFQAAVRALVRAAMYHVGKEDVC